MIHVIGDSHVNFFHGHDGAWVHPWFEDKEPKRLASEDGRFATYTISARLAYTIDKPDVMPWIRAICSKYAQPGDALMFALGEIDTRCHLPQRRWQYGSSAAAIAALCDHYVLSLMDIRRAVNMPVWVYGPVATTNIYDVGDHYYDTVGSEQERNVLIAEMTKYLEDLCARNGFGFVSIYKHLVNVNLTSKRQYWIDSVHIGHAAAWSLFEQEWANVKHKPTIPQV
jgi:hypothetical protein